MMLEPRHLWLQKRLDEILDEITNARKMNNFKEYTDKLGELCRELHYTSNEWHKYYSENNSNEPI